MKMLAVEHSAQQRGGLDEAHARDPLGARAQQEGRRELAAPKLHGQAVHAAEDLAAALGGGGVVAGAEAAHRGRPGDPGEAVPQLEPSGEGAGRPGAEAHGLLGLVVGR